MNKFWFQFIRYQLSHGSICVDAHSFLLESLSNHIVGFHEKACELWFVYHLVCQHQMQGDVTKYLRIKKHTGNESEQDEQGEWVSSPQIAGFRRVRWRRTVGTVGTGRRCSYIYLSHLFLND